MLCWIIPIIVGLICALLGYLLGKRCGCKNLKDCESARENMRKDLEKERADFRKLKLELEENLRLKDNQILGFQSQIKDLQQPPVAQFLFDAEAAKLVFGKKINENDLTIVEGIGPKIQELFKENGIATWKELSETSVERLKEILTVGGERFMIHNPGTWPRQAELAYHGKWQELKEWQDFLVGGVEPS